MGAAGQRPTPPGGFLQAKEILVMTNKTTDKAKNSESINQQADSRHSITLTDKNIPKPDSMTCPVNRENQGRTIGMGDYIWIDW